MTDKQWKQRVDLYQRVQSLCDRPAYFWYNFKTPILCEVTHEWKDVSVDELILRGNAPDFNVLLDQGYIHPQIFCNVA